MQVVATKLGLNYISIAQQDILSLQLHLDQMVNMRFSEFIASLAMVLTRLCDEATIRVLRLPTKGPIAAE
jgi:hypothetical protein